MSGTMETSNEFHFRSLYRQRILRVKKLLWIYFWLLIFEGAVRKWIPPLSAAFFLIRDPVAMMIWFYAMRLKIGQNGYWILFYSYASLITLFGLSQIIIDDLPVPVFLFGWRSYVLHMPIIIVATSILSSEDLKKLGRWILLLSPGMTVLMFAQYVAPSDSWLNRGASGDSGQISSALGHIRPAGTFSFITGPAAFFPIVAALIMLGLAKRNIYPKWLLIISGMTLVASLPASGSRTLALGVAAVILTAFIGGIIRGSISFRVKNVPGIVIGSLAALVVVIGVFQVPIVQDALTTFETRWTQAAGEEGASTTLGNRVLAPFLDVFDAAVSASAFGKGIGAGSNFAAAFLGGESLALGENPWEREMNELGSLAGLSFIAMRSTLSILVVVLAYKGLRRGIVFPWYLLSVVATSILMGGLDQPTAQGFLVFFTGIFFVGLKVDLGESMSGELADPSMSQEIFR